jgi:hypothetical protein
MFLALRCCELTCQGFQVQQQTLTGRWDCKRCGKKQSIQKVFFESGDAGEVRQAIVSARWAQAAREGAALEAAGRGGAHRPAPLAGGVGASSPDEWLAQMPAQPQGRWVRPADDGAVLALMLSPAGRGRQQAAPAGGAPQPAWRAPVPSPAALGPPAAPLPSTLGKRKAEPFEHDYDIL